RLLKLKLGIEVEALSPKGARAMGVAELRGLLINVVEESGPADRIGLKRGDVIDHLGGQQTASLDDVGELMEKAERGQTLPLSVLRIAGRLIYRAQVAIPVR